jgi:hypothetical protein
MEDNRFKINAVAGLSSKLVSLAHKASRGNIYLKNIKLIIFGGE